MSRVQVIQEIMDTRLVQWGASKEEAKVILGGRSTVDTEGDRGVHMPPSGLHVQRRDMERPKEILGGYCYLADHGRC